MLVFEPLAGLPLPSNFLFTVAFILSLVFYGLHIGLLFRLECGNLSLRQLGHLLLALLTITVILRVVLLRLRSFNVFFFFHEFSQLFLVDRLLEQILLDVVYVFIEAVLQTI